MKIRQAKKILKRFETGHPYRMDTRNRASYAWRGKRWCPSPLVGILAVLRDCGECRMSHAGIQYRTRF